MDDSFVAHLFFLPSFNQSSWTQMKENGNRAKHKTQIKNQGKNFSFSRNNEPVTRDSTANKFAKSEMCSILLLFFQR